MITKESIERFLKNECNAEERQTIAAFLENHPEALDTFLPEEEFNTVPAPARDAQQVEASLTAIQTKLFRKRTLIRRIAWSTAAAASLLIIVGLIWKVNVKTAQPSAETVAQTTTQEVSPLNQEVRLNNTDKMMLVALPDGSTIELAPASIIRYEKGLVHNNKRVVYLQGGGLFKVTKDKTKPFTVLSDAIATTVLGTSFLVTAWPSSPTIKVHLYTGKVAVAPSGTVKTKMLADLFLLPGDELTYNRAQLTASVVKANSQETMAVSTEVRERTALQPEWYKFGGQALPQVFDQLSNYYGVEINYVPADVSNRYFTGRFSQTDSIETILKDISLMHGLSLKKVNGVYVFRKKQQ